VEPILKTAKNLLLYTVIRIVPTRCKFGICTVVIVGLNGTLVEDNMHLECEYSFANSDFEIFYLRPYGDSFRWVGWDTSA
jgi:hypothetical protein